MGRLGALIIRQWGRAKAMKGRAGACTFCTAFFFGPALPRRVFDCGSPQNAVCLGPWPSIPQSEIRNPQCLFRFPPLFVAVLVPVPWSQVPVAAVRAVHVSRIFAETLTSKAARKNSACFDQK